MINKRFLVTTAMMTLLSGTALNAETLTVAWYGGNWGEAFDACVAKSFTAETGIDVVADIGNSTTTLAKLQQQGDAGTIDVAYMDGGISELAEAAGVLAPIDLAAIPNAKRLLPQGAYKNGGQVYAVSSGYYSLGLTYNTNEVKEAPDSWEALWDDAYAGASAIPSPNNSSGIPFLFFLNAMLGGSSDDFSKTFEKLKMLDAGLYFDTSGAASNAFQSREIVIGAHFSVGAWDLIDSGLPIGFTIPKEGVWATDARLHIAKGSTKTEAATRFINTALSEKAASCLAEKLYLGPAISGVTLSSEVSRKLPWGEKGSIEDLQLYDWTEVNARRGKLTEMWNREITR